jgi:hypothetical protein
VAQHTSSADAWLSIGGQVYDVSDFLAQHPGGAEVLLQAVRACYSHACIHTLRVRVEVMRSQKCRIAGNLSQFLL